MKSVESRIDELVAEIVKASKEKVYEDKNKIRKRFKGQKPRMRGSVAMTKIASATAELKELIGGQR